MACGRPCPAMSTLYSSARPRCHKTVIKSSLQDGGGGEVRYFCDPGQGVGPDQGGGNCGFRAALTHAIIVRDDHRRSPGRSVGAAAGLPRQPRAGEPHRAGLGAGHQPAGCGRVQAQASAARHPARLRQRGADHPGLGTAGAILSAAARAFRPVRAGLRQGLLGARLPALGAGAGALFDAAGAAQYGDRPERRRSAAARGRPHHRHDARAAFDATSNCHWRCR